MKYHQITGSIKVATGLHIGGSKEEMEIGGLDNPIIRVKKVDKGAQFELPYIPGSSLKGKMRNLIEKYLGLINKGKGKEDPFFGFMKNGEIKNSILLCLFGTANKNWPFGPSRLIVRDAELRTEFEEKFLKGELATEIKMENSIKRDSGQVGSPRPMERVPSGVLFDFEMIVRTLDDNDEKNSDKYRKIIALGMSLLQLDYLGGNGTRGYGKVEFVDTKWNGKPFELMDVEAINNLDLKEVEFEHNINRS